MILYMWCAYSQFIPTRKNTTKVFVAVPRAHLITVLLEARTTSRLKQSKLCETFILYIFNISVIIGHNCITLEGKDREDLKVMQSLFPPERHKVTNLISAASKLLTLWGFRSQ